MPLDEDADVQNILADAVEEEAQSGLSREQLQAELAKVRREAAGRRVSEREKTEALAELQKYKDAEKTELERLTERADKAEALLNAHAQEKAALAAAKSAGLDPELAEFLRGSTEEELRASAEALAERVGATTQAAPQNITGARGGPVRPGHDSNADAFRKLFG